MSVSEYALKRSVNAFSRIWYQVISNLRLDWRRTSPNKAKCNSASWTIIAFRIDNQFELVGTVSRLPLLVCFRDTISQRNLTSAIRTTSGKVGVAFYSEHPSTGSFIKNSVPCLEFSII